MKNYFYSNYSNNDLINMLEERGIDASQYWNKRCTLASMLEQPNTKMMNSVENGQWVRRAVVEA